jgi:hypothetical protein
MLIREKHTIMRVKVTFSEHFKANVIVRMDSIKVVGIFCYTTWKRNISKIDLTLENFLSLETKYQILLIMQRDVLHK